VKNSDEYSTETEKAEPDSTVTDTPESRTIDPAAPALQSGSRGLAAGRTPAATQGEQPPTTTTATISAPVTGMAPATIQIGRFEATGDATSVGATWELWLERFKLYVTHMKMTDESEIRTLFILMLGDGP